MTKFDAVWSIYLDENDQQIERTPLTHRYSYQGHVIHRAGANHEANNTVYSDRLLQQDHKKTRELMKKHFGEDGDYYTGRSPEKVELFLREWMDKPQLKLIYIMQYCNQANGYPYWRFEVNS